MDQKRAKELENKMVHTTLRRMEEDLEKFSSTPPQVDNLNQHSEMKERRLRKSESSCSSHKDVMSSSSSSIYSTAEEDFPSNDTDSDSDRDHDNEAQSDFIESLKTLQDETEVNLNFSNPCPPKVWIATPCGTLSKQNNITREKEKLRKTRSAGPALPDFPNNERISPGRGSKTNLLDVPGAEINQLQGKEKDMNRRTGSSATLTDEDEFKSLELSRSQDHCGHGSFTVAELQRIFDAFKSNGLSSEECDRLIDILGMSQSRNDFQWALYQLGGFNALLYLYARVVEIFPEDAIQSKSLALCLSQLKNHTKVTDTSPSFNFNLLRFLLNSSKSTFGFKTFHVLVHHCLTSSGTKLVDYDLLDSCLLSSWKLLIRVRCLESEAPTGRRTLFECLLTVILDLLLEKNTHRAVNTAELKARKFPDRLLSICCSILSETGSEKNVSFHSKVEEKDAQPEPKAGPSSLPENRNIPLSCIDALRICALVKSIFMELMAPPDAYVAVSLVLFGLYPLLPSEFPPLPERENAFFLYQGKSPSFAVIAEEYLDSHHQSSPSPPKSPYQNVSNLSQEQIMNFAPDSSERVIMLNQDVPEIVGSSPKFYGKESFESSQYDAFKETFQESLMEGLMSVLLNALAILPDGAFFSVLRPHLSSHIFLAYSSHPHLSVKTLAVKLLTSYLSRVKNPCITEFLRNKGFVLTSLYIREEAAIAPVVAGICSGLGPISYPLALGLLDSPTVLTCLVEWVEADPDTVVPALMSMGLIPAILNFYGDRASSLPRALANLIHETIKFFALNPKEDPWKVLFTPALESAPAGNHLTGRFYQEAITLLKGYEGKELKKPEQFGRLLWLLERSSAGKFGPAFDSFLLDLLTKDVMELEFTSEETTEGWKSFVKKHKKRLYYLMGVFLSRMFTPHKSDFEVKQQALRVLLQRCSNLDVWLPKVLKCDSGVERCFTAFLRIFLCEANQKESCQNLEDSNAFSRSRACQSFQALVAEGNRLSRQLQVQVQMPDEALPEDPEEIHTLTDPLEAEADKSLRTRFESILVKAGILSPTNSYSTFSADFRKFKILLETPPICGVSYQELRVCVSLLEKIRSSLTPSTSHFQNENHSKAPSKGKGYACNAAYFSSIFETVSKFGTDVVDSVTRTRTQMGIDIVKSICTREKDITARKTWWALTESLGHPKAPWHFPELYPKFWSLDQCEGPGRIRTRLFREHLKVHQKFVLPPHRVPEEETKHPLEFLFSCDQNYDDLMTFPSIKAEIQYMRFCTRIIPGEEICGEIILNKDTLYFIPELGKCSEKSETLEVPLTSIIYVLRRRYTHENKAVEIFVGCRSFLFTFRNFKDREEFLSVIQFKPHSDKSQSTVQRKNSILMESSLSSMTNRWLKGGLSNFDYLMYLNTAAGRTYCDLMQYPVFPFVLSKYDTPTLDLHAPQSYRDLRRPMAIQDPAKEEHYLSTYNYLKRECDSTPFHYGSHYSNSGIVLHYLIRLPPYTQHFLRYQDGSFDIPDRSFHSIETTYRLSARDSNTDFKEAIPEFYYLPEFLKNLDHYDFGVRQNGKRVDDVKLPPWAKGDARLFTLINRQALESNQVRKLLCDWIDLVFGYKQSGKAAVMAINVFHPSTYEGFEVEGIADDLVKRARRAMVSTYGQTPKQLFTTTHPRSMAMSVENCDMEVLDTVWGIRWGYFLGSPTCSELDVVHTREYADEMTLFETPTRIVFWPKATLIMGDKVVGSWTPNEIVIRSKTVYLCIGDEITLCSTTENSIWIGHQSGKIAVLKFSSALDKAVETIELVGHYKPVKCIDLNCEFSTAVSCSGEDYALIWNMNSTAYVNHIQLNSSIDCVHSSRSTGDIAVVSWTTNSVTLTTINGFNIGSVCPEEKVESACVSSMDPGKNVNLLAVGCDYGHIKFYSTWDLKFINEIKVVPLTTLPIQSIRYSKDGRRLYCLSTNEEVSISAALQLPDSAK